MKKSSKPEKPAAKAAEPEVEEAEPVVEEEAPVPEPEPVEEPAGRLDETVPGGRYEVNGRVVDAHGEPIKGKSKG